MNVDLRRQLKEMGPEYQALVEKMLEPEGPVRRGVSARAPFGWLVAASVVFIIGLAYVLCRGGRPDERVCSVRVTDPHNEYMLAMLRNDEAVQEMIRTQRADGSWKNEFLTRRNAEALKLCHSAEARIAYKKAMRALRFR